MVLRTCGLIVGLMVWLAPADAGVTVAGVCPCVSRSPGRLAIIYPSIHFGGEGVSVMAAAAVSPGAGSCNLEKANWLNKVAADTVPSSDEMVRHLGGERAADIPQKAIEAGAPIFDWRQMGRGEVADSDLPPGSGVWFGNAPLWAKHRSQTLAIAAVIAIQAALISILLHERKRRSDAELDARQRLSELAHVGRQVMAGELSVSIAHEINQPLAAILTNAETAELILQSPSPDLAELKEILADIRRDDQRASEVIYRMRSFLRRTPFELRDVDLNDVMREVFGFLAAPATSRNVALHFQAFPEVLPIKGDPVQLQQVILNLVVNSMEAMSVMPFGRAVIGRTELSGGSSALVSISDSGPGIPSEKLTEIFDPFFTTKQQGMGVGLSIARTIVEAHKGQLWAENQAKGGAVFRLSMPLALH